jgi:hypothetical protein
MLAFSAFYCFFSYIIKTLRRYFSRATQVTIHTEPQSQLLLHHTTSCCFLARSPFHYELFPLLQVQSTGRHSEHSQPSLNVQVKHRPNTNPLLGCHVLTLHRGTTCFRQSEAYISFIFMEPRVHCSVQDSLAMDPILSQLNPIHTLALNFIENHFNVCHTEILLPV